MITLELLPDTSVKPVYLGTVHHSERSVAMALNWDFKCTWPVRRYHCGLEPPNYPMPAIQTAWEYKPKYSKPWFVAWNEWLLYRYSNNGYRLVIDSIPLE